MDTLKGGTTSTTERAGSGDRRDDIANAPDACGATWDEKRHIGAQTGAELTEARFGPSQGQQGIQAFQDRRGITTAASQASPSGNAFT